jgi:DNA-binding phage protein
MQAVTLGKMAMPLTHSFDDTVRERAAADPEFRAALFREAIVALLDGDAETAKIALHAYIKATVGYENLAKATGTPVKSLMRMFGPKGNPTADNLSSVIGVLQKKTRVRLEVRATARAA